MVPVRSARHKFGSEDAKRFYDRIGAWQDAQIYERSALEHLVAHSDFEHASSVFELGCGTGRLAECLFKKHFAGEEIAVRAVMTPGLYACGCWPGVGSVHSLETLQWLGAPGAGRPSSCAVTTFKASPVGFRMVIPDPARS